MEARSVAPPAWLPTWPPQNDAIAAAIERCYRSGDYGNYRSDSHDEFASRLIRLSDRQWCRPMSSGSLAIEMSLRALRLGPESRIAVAAFDYPGVLRAVECLGARPVLVDCRSDHPVIDVDALARLDASAVHAVVASHLYGASVAVDSLETLCEERGWAFIEDACQSIGMTIGGRPVGSFGNLSCLSFGGSKPVTAGSGGAIVGNDAASEARLRRWLDRPSDAAPMSPLQFAVIGPQLDDLQSNLNRKRSVAQSLGEIIPTLPAQTDTVPAYYKFPMVCQSPSHREAVVRSAEHAGLPIGLPFRAWDRVSEKRCEKPMPLVHAKRWSETLALLDHRALLVAADDVPRLCDAVSRVW